ncbi:winged helix-turn-helix transcriptional regulator [Aquimarina atlantica]|uniref:winged helix-turn-helix transcriptional regulator n=1 Tax=Aquimarina atlantica TaxID=1317122 RepID=UPI001F0B0B51|nr:helix-turn-helix domain-containing protein [Aquimarina atlantica]
MKIHIISVLIRGHTLRFMELKRCLHGIASKKLVRDLQDLELNKLVIRNVKNTKPVSVEYSITQHGETLEDLIQGIIDWGIKHRNEIIKN